VFAKQALQALQVHSLHVHISLQGSGLVVGFVRECPRKLCRLSKFPRCTFTFQGVLQGTGLVVGFVRVFAKQAPQALQLHSLHVYILVYCKV